MMPNYENAEPRQAASSYQYCAQRFVQVISVDRDSRGEKRLGGAVLLIAEGVRINAT